MTLWTKPAAFQPKPANPRKLTFIGLADADVEHRCLCQGCAGCRGDPGRPCATKLPDDAFGDRCRWCA